MSLMDWPFNGPKEPPVPDFQAGQTLVLDCEDYVAHGEEVEFIAIETAGLGPMLKAGYRHATSGALVRSLIDSDLMVVPYSRLHRLEAADKPASWLTCAWMPEEVKRKLRGQQAF